MNHNGSESGDKLTEPTPSAVLVINPVFPIGFLVVTRHAHDTLPLADIQRAVQRHATGDWGAVCKEDRWENERSLAEGRRLLSVYDASDGTRFWIITEADRSVTTVLLPQDY